MTWTAYRVVFKLKSPMHIGCGKVGNVQRTRPYATGRSFWGALTMRLTRNQHQPATDSKLYEEVGNKIHDQLAYIYFYPATEANSDYHIHFPWQDERQFRWQFLSSYASTALVYPQEAADEGLLHEVEFLSPRTLDAGEQVYLIGYVFEKEGSTLQWQDACQCLQMGGERGYGWGDVECVEIKPLENHELFEQQATFNGGGDSPIIQAERLLAHALSTGLTAMGEIEPLVGREWRSHNNSPNRYAGQHVEKWGDDLCWVPGSTVRQPTDFTIGRFGLWHLRQSLPDRTSLPAANPD